MRAAGDGELRTAGGHRFAPEQVKDESRTCFLSPGADTFPRIFSPPHVAGPDRVPTGSSALCSYEGVRRSGPRAHGRLEEADENLRFSWGSPRTARILLREVAVSAVELLTHGPLDRLGECPSCCWLFLDVSKNRRRRWCSMATCGSRDKSRRYTRGAPSEVLGPQGSGLGVLGSKGSGGRGRPGGSRFAGTSVRWGPVRRGLKVGRGSRRFRRARSGWPTSASGRRSWPDTPRR
ncbi:CGNR zinc finger domain-containing protein [Streptosporangium sp. NPDC000509]|uniref:CGNR zinc finger domain-containing protein n=1 Tax=Streptosporangium sp. NPDC000509 TaxID=3366186 RepID=UPI00369481E9